ncbi:MAG: hypothetical protein SCJ94_08980 [Bacillota bacterium]|nr:hypothetical protein [Bacillota bacterium]
MSVKNRTWDDIYNNLDALTPEDREEIARRVDSEDKSNEKSVKLLAGQQKLETDVADWKTDMAALKKDMAELKEGQNRIEKFLINLENKIMPKINAMYENSIAN